jgi:hypothetical protein
MHAGRLFIYLKQYLDQRLAGAPAWQRAAAALGQAGGHRRPAPTWRAVTEAA